MNKCLSLHPLNMDRNYSSGISIPYITTYIITQKNEDCFKKYVLQHIFHGFAATSQPYLASDILMETPKLLFDVGNAVDDTSGVFT